MTAVTLQADAILQALIIISSSINMSLTSALPVCTMYTSSPRTDSPISTLENKEAKRMIWCFKFLSFNILSIQIFNATRQLSHRGSAKRHSILERKRNLYISLAWKGAFQWEVITCLGLFHSVLYLYLDMCLFCCCFEWTECSRKVV